MNDEEDEIVRAGEHVFVILQGQSMGKTELALQAINEAFEQLGHNLVAGLVNVLEMPPPDISVELMAGLLKREREYREPVPTPFDNHHRGGATARRRWKKRRASGK